MNGIPVLASSSGGLPEAVAGGGIILDAPKECAGDRNNWLALPSEESCRPWADALYKLYDERMSAYWQEKCQKAAQTNSPLACAEKLLRAIGPLLQSVPETAISPTKDLCDSPQIRLRRTCNRVAG